MEHRRLDVGQAAREILSYQPDSVDDPVPKFVSAVQTLTMMYQSGALTSMAPVLPLLLSLKGKPYSLKGHEPMEPMFSLRPPHSTVMKCARQVSKTLRVNGLRQIYMENGEPVAGENLAVGARVLAVDAGFRRHGARVISVFRNEPKRILRVTTRTGSVVELAVTHPLRTLYGFTRGADLRVGARVAALRRGGLFGDLPVDRARIGLTAYMIGDGSCMVQTSGFTSASAEVLDEVTAFAASAGTSLLRRRTKGLASQLRFHRNGALRGWLKEDGLLGKYSYEKEMPRWVFDLSKEDTILFVSRLWATDGCITKSQNGTPTISYSSTSRHLAFQLKSLLLKLEIPTSVKRRATSCNGKRCRDRYTVRVETFAGWKNFLEQITVPGKPGISLPARCRNNNRDTVPMELTSYLKEKLTGNLYRHGDSLRRARLRQTLEYPLSCDKLQRYVAYFERIGLDATFLRDLADGDVLWDEVVSIEDIGEHPTWDIEVEGSHTYVIDGLVSHNSTTIAGKDILLTAIIPYLSTLYISPLYEQTRRFSSNYVRPFLEDSPVRGIMLKPRVEKSVLQRSVANNATMHFTFASTDCDRTRGISSDSNTFDEVQDFDPDFIPIINEALSHSEYDLRYYSGTPLTSDNILEVLWQKSSQAEWATKCQACNYWNIAGLAYDLLDMIQKDGVSCTKCGKEIFPADGLWVHAFSDRRPEFSGYHAPQAIFPLHYAPNAKTGKKHRWRELWQAKNELSRSLFLNEKCGESCDERPTLLSVKDLQRASTLPWPNVFSIASKQNRRGYHMVVLGADWGGRGRDEVSYTVFAVLGFLPNGNFDVLYGERLPLDLDPTEEAQRALQIYKTFHCSLFAHDYNGAGAIRQTLMRQAGLPQRRVFPAVYSRVSLKGLVTYNPPMEHSAQWYYTVDKARSLVLLCQMIKQRFVRFPSFDSWAKAQGETDNPLGNDLLALVEDRKALEGAGDIYLITKRASASDDFSSAVNYASLAYWYSQQRFPDLVNKLGMKLTPAQADAMSPRKTTFDAE